MPLRRTASCCGKAWEIQTRATRCLVQRSVLNRFDYVGLLTIFMETSACLKRTTRPWNSFSPHFLLLLWSIKPNHLHRSKKFHAFWSFSAFSPPAPNVGPYCALLVMLVLIIYSPALTWMSIAVYAVLHDVLKTHIVIFIFLLHSSPSPVTEPHFCHLLMPRDFMDYDSWLL